MKAEMAITGVSCWHLCHDESAAMWQVYAASGSGIAIQSTVGRLKSCFTPYRHHVFVGKVFYVDHVSEPFPNEVHFEPLLHKRRAFDYERELRAMTQPYESFADIPEPPPPGWHVPVNLKMLYERLVIAPRQPGWFPSLIKSLVDRYELDPALVHSSTLDLLPPDLG